MGAVVGWLSAGIVVDRTSTKQHCPNHLLRDIVTLACISREASRDIQGNNDSEAMSSIGPSEPDDCPEVGSALDGVELPCIVDLRHPSRRRLIATGVIGAAAVVVGASVVLARRLHPSSTVPALVGQRAPAFVLDGLGGQAGGVSLAAFAGRPLVINFWASWCVPCRTEMPVLEAVHEALGDRVAFVGIDHQDDHTSAVEFIAYTGVTYESGFDPTGAVAASYGLYGLPTTVLVAPDGLVVAEVAGAVTEGRLLTLVHDRFGITSD